MDPGEIFAEARRRGAGELLEAAKGNRGRAWARARQLFGRWPVQLRGEDRWEPMPEAGALPHEERLILAVRGGWVDPQRIPRLEPGLLPGLVAQGQAGRMRGWRAIWGPEVRELIALPPPGRRERWRFLIGGTAALGDPDGDLCEGFADPREEEPIPVARSLGGWLAGVMRGAVLPLGDEWTQAAYLRRLVAPIVAEDLAHGLALERMLRRPERALPEIRLPTAASSPAPAMAAAP